jgi:hypothetical protein
LRVFRRAGPVLANMGLPWVRLDTQFASNPKILFLVEDRRFRAAFVWLCSLAYSGAHGTDGFVPTGALALLHGMKSDAAALVEVGLWIEVVGGWEINSWQEFQGKGLDAMQRKKRAQRAALKRWHGSEQEESPF